MGLIYPQTKSPPRQPVEHSTRQQIGRTCVDNEHPTGKTAADGTTLRLVSLYLSAFDREHTPSMWLCEGGGATELCPQIACIERNATIGNAAMEGKNLVELRHSTQVRQNFD